MIRNRYSLRRRLLILLIGVMSVLWLGSAVFAFKHALLEVDELFDAQMVQASELLLGLVRESEVETAVGAMPERPHPYRMPIFYQVMDEHGGAWRMLAHSPSAPEESLPVERLGDGFERVEYQDNSWRVLVRSDTNGDGRRFRVVVGQRYSLRDDLAHEFAEHLAIPLGLGFPLMALGIGWVVNRAMRPVREAADRVSGMEVENLKPIQLVDACPSEIAPLIDAIDALTGRVSRAMEHERRFTADAAHELRTPLAALKVQAQVAMRVVEPDERRRALRQVLAGVERMTHLVEQLLMLARLDPAAPGSGCDTCTDLSDAAAIACAELAPRAITRNQELQLNAPDSALVKIEGVWAEALVRNLVDNALRYGPDGGRIEVEVLREPQGIAVNVRDDGPGVAPGNRPRLLERFFRAADPDTDGCGLGLSIVARIVEAAQAKIEFTDGLERSDGGYGLGVSVRFPAA